jgi:hypothetical protein
MIDKLLTEAWFEVKNEKDFRKFLEDINYKQYFNGLRYSEEYKFKNEAEDIAPIKYPCAIKCDINMNLFFDFLYQTNGIYQIFPVDSNEAKKYA